MYIYSILKKYSCVFGKQNFGVNLYSVSILYHKLMCNDLRSADL